MRSFRGSLRPAYCALAAFVYLLAMFLPSDRAGAQAPPPRDVHILAFGDSLTAGYGLPRGQGFAPQLEDALRRNGVRAFVTDAGVSGDTAAAGRARLGWTLSGLRRKPDLAIVALGANDMLRGLRPEQTRADLDAIVGTLRRQGIPVLIAGMRAAPNLGRDYAGAYEAIFTDLAETHDAALYPFFLDGVVGRRALNLADGVHPNFQGIKVMVTRILPTVMKAIGAEAEATAAAAN